MNYRRLILFIIATLVCKRISAQEMRELYRIRIQNCVNGAVEVSLDKGEQYALVGRVIRPATQVANGFSASKYAEVGKVAATAVHGIRIKVGEIIEKSGKVPQVISILPREFEQSPRGFGGHVAGLSGIATDIPTGTAIFRNLAPFVGNQVYLQRHGEIVPVRNDYLPTIGDTLIIVVEIPVHYPRQIVIENKINGRVEVIYDDSSETVAVVERPVRGIGRFDATGYTGTGRINTNHTGVITISTAPITNGGKDGTNTESRGGFMIQPNRHGRSASEVAQVMLVAPSEPERPSLEGTPPLFRGNIGLAWDPSSEDNSFAVDIRCENSDWIRIPPLIGKQDDAFVRLPTTGKAVTELRIRFPKYEQTWLRDQVRKAYEDHLKRAARFEEAITGCVSFCLDAAHAANAHFVGFYLDGECRGIVNSPPYCIEIDTSKLTAGEHIAEIKVFDQGGANVKTFTKRFITRGSEKANQ